MRNGIYSFIYTFEGKVVADGEAEVKKDVITSIDLDPGYVLNPVIRSGVACWKLEQFGHEYHDSPDAAVLFGVVRRKAYLRNRESEENKDRFTLKEEWDGEPSLTISIRGERLRDLP
jgi:hypothetical protein